MTAVFVHGVPEDQHLWDELRAELPHAQTAALNLPGFGAPLPEGFSATKDGYLAWLVHERDIEPHCTACPLKPQCCPGQPMPR